MEINFCLQPPEIGNLEEKAAPRLEEAVGFHIPVLPPFDPVIKRSIAQLDDRPGDVGEGGQKVGQQLLPEGVVFQYPAEEQILVDLVSQPSPADGVVVDLLTIGIPEKVGVGQAEGQVEVIRGKIDQGSHPPGPAALEGVGGIADGLSGVEVETGRQLFRDLAASVQRQPPGQKPLSQEDFGGVDTRCLNDVVPLQDQSQAEGIGCFEQAAFVVPEMGGLYKGIDPSQD